MVAYWHRHVLFHRAKWHNARFSLAPVSIYDTIVPDMLTAFIKSDIMIAILELFFSRPGRRFYLRELQRMIGKPVGSLQRHLSNLAEEGILKSEMQGPLKYFSVDESYIHYPELKNIVLREIRRQKLDSDLRKLLKRLKKSYHPEKIILFGSMARGRVSPDSDIDIMVIKRDVPKRYWDRVKEISPLVANCDVGVDFVIWTPKELEAELTKNAFLRDEILKGGKILYERAA